MATMKAIGNTKKGDASGLIEFDAPRPTQEELGPRDMIVKIQGASVNPVDYKVREWFDPEEGTRARILGWDAAGIVEACGSDVKFFKEGDEVFYAGELFKPGTNAQYQKVDERIVGKKPSKLGFAEAAGLPLTTITAYELLFDSLKLPKDGTGGAGETILVLGAAGGVGSILIQLAKKLTKLTVVATASRSNTIDWVKKMGADHVISHRESLQDQLKAINLTPKYVAGLNGTQGHFENLIELIKPRGHIAIIDDPESLDLTKYPNYKMKALTFSWEFMFARPMFQAEDIEAQHELLNKVSELIDDGTLISTVTENLGKLSLETIKTAHSKQASGKVFGKMVMDGY